MPHTWMKPTRRHSVRNTNPLSIAFKPPRRDHRSVRAGSLTGGTGNVQGGFPEAVEVDRGVFVWEVRGDSGGGPQSSLLG